MFIYALILSDIYIVHKQLMTCDLLTCVHGHIQVDVCKMYDLCIVGAGLIGSAAARHASQIHGKKICVIGPTEPQVCEHYIW